MTFCMAFKPSWTSNKGAMELRKRLTQIPLEQRREARPTMPKSLI